MEANSGFMAGIEIRVLGVTTVLVHGRSVRLTPVERNLLALLVAAGPVGVNTDQLADGLWDDRLPNSWRASLRNTISRLNIKVRKSAEVGERLRIGTGEDQDVRAGLTVALIAERTAVRRLQVEPYQVDAWRLLAWAGGDRDSGDPDLLLGTPFSGCEVPGTVQVVSDQIEAARHDIVTNWDANEVRLPARTLAAIRQVCATNPFDQHLAAMAARLHLLVDDRSGAGVVISMVERELTLNRRSLSPPLVSLKQRLEIDDPTLWSKPDQPESTRPGATACRTSKPLRSSALTRLALNQIVGRDQLLEQLVTQLGPENPDSAAPTRGLSLHGPGGVGKTRLAVEAALRLQTDGFNTIYVVADDHGFGPLQPFLQSLRFLQPVVEPYLTRLDEREVATRCWAVMLQAIESAMAPGPTCLVADDVHRFDEHSRSLLLSLCRADLSSPLSIIAAGRAEPGAIWSSWLDDLSRAGLCVTEVEPLGESAIVDLIDSRSGLRPERGRQSALGQVHNNRLAQLVLELSSGVPQVALWLLDQHEKYWAGDAPSSPVFDLKDRPGRATLPGTGYAVMVEALDPELIEIGSVASVLGMRFTADELTTLTDLDFESCVSRLDDLVDHQLLTTTAPGRYGFLHILVAEAFDRHVESARRRRLHARAFRLVDDVHRRARHAANSVPVTPLAEATAALARSARAHFAAGDHVSSWATWQRVMEFAPEAVDQDDSIMALESADRAGFDTGSERERLVARFLRAGLPEVAVRAAVSGLPATELVQGDPERVRAIRMIDPALLDHEHAILWRSHLSRQLVWLGEMAEARRLAREVWDSAVTADEKADGWLAVDLANTWTHGDHAFDEPAWIDDVTDPELKARVARSINATRIVAGQSRSQRLLFDEQLESARRRQAPLDEWHALIQKATVLTDLGRREEASVLSERALALGLRTGIRVAYGVHETQRVGWAIQTRELSELLDHMEGLGNVDTPNPVQLAVLAACRLAAADRHPNLRREAVNLATRLAENLGDGPFSPSVAGLMAEVVGVSGDRGLTTWAEENLDPLRGRHVVVAAAITNLGPCHGLLAHLTHDQDRRRHYLELARDEADAQRLPLWQVVGRLRLGHHLAPGPHRDRLVDEATALATTPWLRRIVTRWIEGETGHQP